MDSHDSEPESTPDTSTDASTEDDSTDTTETQRGGLPVSRRGALAAAAGIGSLSLLSGPATAQGAVRWKQDRDAEGNDLLNLGALGMQANSTKITDFTGENLSIEDGVLNATAVTPWEDTDGNGLLEAPGFDGISVSFVETRVFGTTDSTALEGVVDDERFLRVVPTNTGEAPNILAGHRNNEVADEVVGATIAGGGAPEKEFQGGDIVIDLPNTVKGDYGSVGGGQGNDASGEEATVSGGFNNSASGPDATVGGGRDHEASGRTATIAGGFRNKVTGSGATVAGGITNNASARGATVPGGRTNSAGGEFSFAAGHFAVAADNHSFVWNDGSGASDGNGVFNDRFSSSTSDEVSNVTGDETFHVKAKGGVRIITDGINEKVTYIPGGSAGWNSSSTRAAKTNIDPVDPQQVLAGVEEMEVSTWEYRDDNGDGQGMRHIGPMAEDFHDAFDVGDTDTAINSINADGVALAAIQGLAQQLNEKDNRIDRLESTVERKDTELDAVRADLDARDERIDDLEAENEQLRERLTAVEDRLASLETNEDSPAPADD